MTEMNKKTPLVSVCCLTYNQENTIAQTIEGVLSQKTDFDIELIIHDDASTDKTTEIVRKYAGEYPDRIRPIFQKENQYHKCNLAKEYVNPLVRGKYVAICEGDDYWTSPDKLQKQIDYMEANPDCTMTFHAIEQLDSDGRVIDYYPMSESGYVSTELIIKRGGLFCPSVSLVIRSDICRKWPEFRVKARIYDYPIQILSALEGKVYYFHEKMGVYRYASAGSWTKERHEKTDFFHIQNEIEWLKMLDEYSNGEYTDAIRFQIARLWLAEYKKNLDSICRKHAKKAIDKLHGKEKMKMLMVLYMFQIGGKPLLRLVSYMRKNGVWNNLRNRFIK